MARTIPHILKSGATKWSIYAKLGTYAPVRRSAVQRRSAAHIHGFLVISLWSRPEAVAMFDKAICPKQSDRARLPRPRTLPPPVLLAVSSPDGSQTLRTVMRFSVSVPVLSVRMTVVAPRVLNGREALDQRVLAGHAPHAARERKGRHDR